MKKEFIKQKIKRNVNLLLFSILILVVLLTVVLVLSYRSNNRNRGFYLQQFTVKNAQLDVIIAQFVDSAKSDGLMLDEIPILILHNFDSVPAFYFTTGTKTDIYKLHIFEDNRRIVGYIESKSIDIIVLSTVNSLFDFEMEFYDFIIPETKTKQFEFIDFLKDMYCLNDGIPCPPLLFDPQYSIFLFKSGTFVPIEIDNKLFLPFDE